MTFGLLTMCGVERSHAFELFEDSLGSLGKEIPSRIALQGLAPLVHGVLDQLCFGSAMIVESSPCSWIKIVVEN